MSEDATPGVDPEDHREQVDWIAESSVRGSNRRLHRVDGDHDREELTQGEEVQVACGTSLTDEDSYWRAKPSAAYPPGFRDLCTDPEFFGSE